MYVIFTAHQHKLCQQLCCWRLSEADSDEREGRECNHPLDNRQSSKQDVQVKETQLKISGMWWYNSMDFLAIAINELNFVIIKTVA